MNKNRSDIFDMLIEDASQSYYNKYAYNNEEFADLRDSIMQMQEAYKKMDLSDEQKKVIDGLIKYNAELFDECVEKIYRQGLIDGVSILRELGVL